MSELNALSNRPPVIIVGAGLSGLTCARYLHKAGVPFQIVEASDGVGGRVRTDRVDGFLLDRGFQVYLSAYPQAGEILNIELLDLRSFEPGALVFDGINLNRVMDVFRKPTYMIQSLFSPIGCFSDKIRVALLRFRAMGSTEEEINQREDQTTEKFLSRFGFSSPMINGFFRAFYGGIFLERDLRTSSRMFEFTFKMFSMGHATLPAYGMASIPHQLSESLPTDSIQLNSPVSSVTKNSVTLHDGSKIIGSQVVIATQAAQTSELVPEFSAIAPTWRSVTNVYFKADKSPLNEAIIALNGSENGLINNVCVPSDVSPAYAPEKQSLISVSLLGIHTSENIPSDVREELVAWFGEEVTHWKHLRTDLIKHALPEQGPDKSSTQPKGFIKLSDTLICGDHTMSASIEGSIISGKLTAEEILNSLNLTI